jgi:hypothetical protein
MDIGPPAEDKPAIEETEEPIPAESEPQEPTQEKPPMTQGTKIAMGVIGAGAGGAVLFALAGSGGGSGSSGNDDVSPSNIP